MFFYLVGYFLCFLITLSLTLLTGQVAIWSHDFGVWVFTFVMAILTAVSGYATVLSWKKGRNPNG